MELDIYEQKFSKTSIIVGLFTVIPYLIILALVSTESVPSYFLSIGNIIMLPLFFITQHRYIPHTYNPIGKLLLNNDEIIIENNAKSAKFILSNEL